MKVSPLVSLFLFTLVDVLGFSIILPLFPYLTKNIMTPTEVGFLQSSNALAQLVATPIIGALSDMYGRRPLLLVSVFSTLLSFLILANAETKFWMFFSRILDGLIGGNISLAHAYITDITDEKDRSKGMGMIGGAFGLGFVVGPACGGMLLKYHHQAPSYVAAALCLINLICVYYFLPESLPEYKRKKKIDGSFMKSIFYLFRLCATNIEIRNSLLMRFIYMFIFTLFEYSFSFFNIQKLHNDSATSGLLLCWFGIMYSVAQAAGIRILRKRFSDEILLKYSVYGLPIFYAILSTNQTTFHMFLSLIPLGLFSGLINTLVNTKVSNEIKKFPEIVGGGLGISSALGSLARIVAPPFAGFVIQNVDYSLPFLLCSVKSISLIFL